MGLLRMFCGVMKIHFSVEKNPILESNMQKISSDNIFTLLPAELLAYIFRFLKIEHLSVIHRSSKFFAAKTFNDLLVIPLIKDEIRNFSNFYSSFIDWSELNNLSLQQLHNIMIISYLLNKPTKYDLAGKIVKNLEQNIIKLPTFSKIINAYKAQLIIDQRYQYYLDPELFEAGFLLAQEWYDDIQDITSSFVLTAYWNQKIKSDPMEDSRNEFEAADNNIARFNFQNLIKGFAEIDPELQPYLNEGTDPKMIAALMSPYTPIVIKFLNHTLIDKEYTYRNFFNLDPEIIQKSCSDPTAENLERLVDLIAINPNLHC